MCSLKYEIIENPNYTMCSKVGIKTFPENEPLMFFLSGLKKDQFPHYINELLENRSFGVENTSFIFKHEMDGLDQIEFYKRYGRNLQENEIEIWFYNRKTNYSVIKVKKFEKIFYDYSKKLLEVYQSDITLPDTWKSDMEVALEKLKVKIDNESLN